MRAACVSAASVCVPRGGAGRASAACVSAGACVSPASELQEEGPRLHDLLCRTYSGFVRNLWREVFRVTGASTATGAKLFCSGQSKKKSAKGVASVSSSF